MGDSPTPPLAVECCRDLPGDFDKSWSTVMGGIGSGGWNRRGCGIIGQYRSIEVGRLHKEGVLQEGWRGGWAWWSDGERTADIVIHGGRDRIRLRYRVQAGDTAPVDVDEAIALLWRPCPFGGERPFFRCPGCDATVRRLHGAGTRFLCRRCHRLGYGSQREREHDRALRQANRLRARLGGEPGLGAAMPRRPRHMRRRTDQRLVREILELELTAEDYAAQLLHRLQRRTDRPRSRRFWR